MHTSISTTSVRHIAHAHYNLVYFRLFHCFICFFSVACWFSTEKERQKNFSNFYEFYTSAIDNTKHTAPMISIDNRFVYLVFCWCSIHRYCFLVTSFCIFSWVYIDWNINGFFFWPYIYVYVCMFVCAAERCWANNKNQRAHSHSGQIDSCCYLMGT